MAFAQLERKVAEMNPYTGWYGLYIANQEIAKDPKLKKILDQLGADGTGNIPIARVIGGWKFNASIGNPEARDALVLAGGFMYDDWVSKFPAQESRVFIATKASECLLLLDKKESKALTSYGQDAFNDVILPVVLLGGRLDEESLGKFITSMETYAFDNSPYHTLNGHVGLRDLISKFRGRVSGRLKEIVHHIPSTSDVRGLISRFTGSAP